MKTSKSQEENNLKDTYFRNIIFSNISEILFMCIADYFKLLSYSFAIKPLNLKFLTESKVKKKFV